jgi:tetratricopeptide (TPR) repeat protein
VTFALLIAASARADEWMAPKVRTVVSPNGKLQAVITPAPDASSVATAAIGPKGGTATTFTLATTWSPVDVVLFDDGSLLALDHWHQLGYGKVATVYERDGKVRWTKTLAELAGQAFVDAAPHSVSSIWWRKTPLEWTLATNGKSGVVTLHDENQLEIVLRDGAAKVVNVAKLPDDPDRLLNRARSLRDGDRPQAIALLDRAIAKAPDRLDVALEYVELLQRDNNHARAVALLDRLSLRWTAKTGYDVANIDVAWAKSLVALSRATDAERVLRHGIVAAPVYENPPVALATLLFDRNRRKDADTVLAEYVGRLEKAPWLDTYSLAHVAEVYQRRKDYPKALAVYLKGYKPTEVTNQFLYENLAKLYEEMGNDAEAIRIDEQLLAHFQKLGSAFDMYKKATTDELARLRAKPKR